jgi:hypothetical protein
VGAGDRDAVRAATLPHGIVRDGVRHRDALLRVPTGADEALLMESLGSASAAARASALLASCVTRLGGEDAGPQDVRALVVGDRDALLLQLRAAAFGERVACVLDCPSCGERMDLELAIGDLLVEGYADAACEHSLALDDGSPLRFRLPTGADLEAAAEAADVEAGATLLLSRCLLGDRDAAALSDAARDALEDELARLDPQAELRIAVACPSCGEPLDATLDAAALVLDELAGSADGLFREVHALARHYHWSERDILGLALPRRRRYLELLVADEVAEELML